MEAMITVAIIGVIGGVVYQSFVGGFRAWSLYSAQYNAVSQERVVANTLNSLLPEAQTLSVLVDRYNSSQPPQSMITFTNRSAPHPTQYSIYYKDGDVYVDSAVWAPGSAPPAPQGATLGSVTTSKIGHGITSLYFGLAPMVATPYPAPFQASGVMSSTTVNNIIPAPTVYPPIVQNNPIPALDPTVLIQMAQQQGNYYASGGLSIGPGSFPAGASCFWQDTPCPVPPNAGNVPWVTYVNGNLSVSGASSPYGIYYVTGNITFNGNVSPQAAFYTPSGNVLYHGAGGSQITGGIIAGGTITGTGSHASVQYNYNYMNSLAIFAGGVSNYQSVWFTVGGSRTAYGQKQITSEMLGDVDFRNSGLQIN